MIRMIFVRSHAIEPEGYLERRLDEKEMAKKFNNGDMHLMDSGISANNDAVNALTNHLRYSKSLLNEFSGCVRNAHRKQ